MVSPPPGSGIYSSVLLLFVLLLLFLKDSSSFLIGGCIGPRKVFERFLTPDQAIELTRFIEDRFDGRNKEQVLSEVCIFVKDRITLHQWKSIEPEIVEYQTKNISCSPYSLLLPPKYFRQLTRAVRRAVETGADRSKIRYLVEDYLDRILFTKEFVREYRKQPPVDDPRQVKFPKIHPSMPIPVPVPIPYTIPYPEKINAAKIVKSPLNPLTLETGYLGTKVIPNSKPLFPILDIWKVFPGKRPENGQFYYKIG